MMLGTVLVTGASGFIGRHVARSCRARGSETVVLRRSGSTSAVVHGGRIVEVALDDEVALRSAVRTIKPSVMIHLAAYGVSPQDRDPYVMQRVNVDLGAALVRAAADCGSVFVSAGSCAEYAEPRRRERLDETSPLESGKLYGSSKAAGGLLSLAIATALAVPMRHLRLFNVYGPGEAAHRLLPSLASERATGRRVRLSAGLQVRDFIHVEDVAEGMLVAAERLISGTAKGATPLNLCTGVGTSVRDLVTLAAQALAIAPENLGFGDLPMRPDEIPYLVGQPDKMTFDLGWRPAYGPAAGVEATIASL
ncbi:MAG: hypothetical protein DI527_11020 [Chelatococcus sp.]|nr:MAG: hypothetical protein DI527_11020 [Chelatococcus sp.]